MSLAVDHPRSHRLTERRVRPLGLAGRASVATSGLAITLLGAWAGVVAFIGPEWGYRITASHSFVWSTDNWLLHLVPGAIAFIAGLLIISRAPSGLRGGVGTAALAAAVAGAWLVIGPVLWPWFEPGLAYGRVVSPGWAFVQQVGADLGPGLLLAFLGGLAYKAAHPGVVSTPVPAEREIVEERPVVAEERPVVAEERPVAVEEPMTMAEPMTMDEPGTTTETRTTGLHSQTTGLHSQTTGLHSQTTDLGAEPAAAGGEPVAGTVPLEDGEDRRL